MFKQVVDACKLDKTSFAKGWARASSRFDAPLNFCSGLASVFPNIATVESDFSVVRWEENVYLNGLMDFSLEAIIQAKQFRRPQELYGALSTVSLWFHHIPYFPYIKFSCEPYIKLI